MNIYSTLILYHTVDQLSHLINHHFLFKVEETKVWRD